MIEQILKEFRETYSAKAGNLSELASAAKRAHLGFSARTCAEIYALASEENAPLKIGVIGQFSSGKSTFLNLFLPQPVLAAGARPVSVVCARIRHGQFRSFARFGAELIEVCGVQNDQNSAAEHPDELLIFSPDERLKGLEFIDTPGLNANEADEAHTSALFDAFDAVIWLSQATAASKASEKLALEQLECQRRWCLLTLADLLSESERAQALAHAREFFGGDFEGISLFSAKWAQEGAKKGAKDVAKDGANAGGMGELERFLRSLGPDDKRAKISKNLRQIALASQAESTALKADLSRLKAHCAEFLATTSTRAASAEAAEASSALLDAIKKSAAQLANALAAALSERQAALYVPARGLLARGKFERREYRFQSLRPSQVAAEIFYNDEKFSKQLRALRSKILAIFSQIEDGLNADLAALSATLAREQTKVLGRAKASVHDEGFYEPAQHFFAAVNEVVLQPFAAAVAAAGAKLRLLREQIDIKALSSFEKALALSAAFFYEKIQTSREFYEQNPEEFHIYAPNYEEIYGRICSDLCLYEFEELLENKRTVQKILSAYEQAASAANAQLVGKIDAALARISAREEEIAQLFGKFISSNRPDFCEASGEAGGGRNER